MMSELLRVDAITRRFGGLVALHDLSFSVSKGEIVGLIGPNGAGKTTAFNVITGTIAPTSGSIHFADNDISAGPPSRVVATGLTRTFQSAASYPMETVAGNVYRGLLTRVSGSVVGVLAGRKARDLRMRQLDDEIDRILNLTDLSDWRDARAGSLPYGVQKRLGIAAALATRPQMLLLDEPAAGLNHEECRELSALLRRLRDSEGLTLLLVEHHMAMVMELCHRIVVLVQGEKLAEGTPTEIHNNTAVIEAYLGAPDYAHA